MKPPFGSRVVTGEYLPPRRPVPRRARLNLLDATLAIVRTFPVGSVFTIEEVAARAFTGPLAVEHYEYRETQVAVVARQLRALYRSGVLLRDDGPGRGTVYRRASE